MTSSVDLDEALEGIVNALVEAGRYSSRNEVLSEGVRLVSLRERRLEAMDAALARGIADAEAGRVTPLDVVAARFTARYEATGDTGSE